MGQVWAVNSLGGYMYAANLSKELRMAVQPLVKFRQFADVKDAAFGGKKRGDTFHWNVYLDVATQGTTLTETSTMPETNFTIVQGTLTITEYGNSVPYSGKLDDLSYHPVKEIINKALKNDAKKALDTAAYNQFNATLLRAVSTASGSIVYTTNGTATATNNRGLSKSEFPYMIDWMKERNIPPYEGDDYFCIAHPTTFRDLKNDLQSVFQYTVTGFQRIVNGEVGRYENCRFVEQTNIAKATWANGKSNWAFIFGDDTVAEAIAVPEEIRGKIPTDYGRSQGVAWYYLGGFGIVHTVASQSRILKWDSAG